uniref:Uncharacterized protein n=1 Tax=Rhizophora mucronata TaxID=61149 RepID=A0A2P2PKX6_RHIMU
MHKKMNVVLLNHEYIGIMIDILSILLRMILQVPWLSRFSM